MQPATIQEITAILQRLNTAKDRAALFAHDLTDDWADTDPASPASRSELVNHVAIMGDYLGALGDSLEWIVRVLAHSTAAEDDTP